MTKILIFERIIFYLTLLFLPTQLGRHFWPEFSTVLGMRIDYLSPTLYLTDILIFLLFLSFVFRKVMVLKINLKFSAKGGPASGRQISNFKLKRGAFVFFILFMIFGILQAKNPFAGWYGLLKFFEFFFFGFYVSWQKISFSKIAFTFSLAIIFESFLAIAQYLAQGSLGGLFYFFGERAFNSQTPGIANASLNGELILRPYGTLPHPNVLGGYLAIAMAIAIVNIKYEISNIKRTFFLLAIGVGTGALVLTMSRIAIFLWLAVLGFNLIKRKGSVFLFLLPVLIIFTVSVFFPLRTRLLDVNIADESVAERVALIKSSLLMIKDSPLFGVGINNFLVSLPSYQGKPADIFALQPVHNIYLLIVVETGILGLVFFLWFLRKTYRRIKKQELRIKGKASMIHNPLFLVLALILTLGFFDHYFLTLQQGRMLLSFVLGLCWVKAVKP